jgi:hypothetical protein
MRLTVLRIAQVHGEFHVLFAIKYAKKEHLRMLLSLGLQGRERLQHIAIRAMHRTGNAVVPPFPFGNGLPLCHRTVKPNIGQGRAVLERTVADPGHAVRDTNALKCRAVAE